MTIGIIAEFNPFHNGHVHLINEIKKKYPDATLVLVVSGNFTQRGVPSIMNKWDKTDISLKYGIDLVVELPIPFVIQSADYFSYGGVTLLEKLKVDRLIFGSESDNISTLEEIADVQLNNKEFDNLVKLYCKSGYNYPTALSLAIEELSSKKITTPNDLLGISYIKSIKENNYNIKYECIKRTNDYNSTKLEESISSATSIREAVKNKVNIDNQVPKEVLSYLNKPVFIDDFFKYLKYKIITEDDLSIYNSVDKDIESKLKKEIINSNSIDEYINKLKSKRYTYNRLSRMLLHILLNFTKEKSNLFNEISYIRLLGFNDKGRVYLNKIKKYVDIPIISKINREKDPMLDYEIETTKIYGLVYDNIDELVDKEYQNKLYTDK
ncbi:MAG: nucleotidyltransferase [Bacilli bacterium]|nr:nucleotidyltransferase [Bacilli bacterium]